MLKTAKEMTSDILSSLRIPNAPEAILIEAYIEKCLESAKKEGKDEGKLEVIEDYLKKLEE